MESSQSIVLRTGSTGMPNSTVRNGNRLLSVEMKLPGGERANVDVAKLRDYCLNPTHPRGRHKARVSRPPWD